jgi:hypothetical protein
MSNTDTTTTDTTTEATWSFADREHGDTQCVVVHSDGERCEAPIYAKRSGLCSKHYVAMRAGKSLDAKVKPVAETVCKEDGCERPIYAKRSGLCSKHYVLARKQAAAEAAAAEQQESA